MKSCFTLHTAVDRLLQALIDPQSSSAELDAAEQQRFQRRTLSAPQPELHRIIADLLRVASTLSQSNARLSQRLIDMAEPLAQRLRAGTQGSSIRTSALVSPPGVATARVDRPTAPGIGFRGKH